jgi:uncharacterized protein YcbX
MAISVVRICRYPVKGLSAEDLARVRLTAGQCLPHDRRVALAQAAPPCEPARPAWRPKTSCLMLMRDEQRAQLRTRFDEQRGFCTLGRDGHMRLNAAMTEYQYVSRVHLASLRALEPVVQVSVDPLRFRASLYIAGLPAWTEFDGVGSELMVGRARLQIVSRMIRCAATTVNPTTAERDLNVPTHLQQAFGHGHMGIDGAVVGSGEIVTGDTVLLNETRQL